jgi:hypothetical protein
MLSHVTVVRTDVVEERIASIIRVIRFGELGTIVFLRSLLLSLVTANVVPSSLILVALMIEAILSSETSVPTRSTRRNIPGDGILQSHRRETLKSYIALTGWSL